jgi:NodT family efflux transporter outer membrane factor (OMF) lipoprotein
MRTIRTIGFVLLFSALIAACVPFRPASTSVEPTLPPTYSRSTTTEPSNRWWETFNDAQLNILIETALADNFSIKESWARLEQSGALAVKAGAAFYPTLSVDAGASLGRQRTENGQAVTDSVEKYSLGLLSQYEVDLWGRIRSEHEAAVLSASATRSDLNTVAMTVAASVAERWLRIISQGMQKQLLEEQLAANQTVLELVELRFRKSLASALDVLQQRQVVARSQAQIPLVEQRKQLLQNELALLLGRAPRGVVSIKRDTLVTPADLPATGIPARLLTARPDIQAAAQRLQMAKWRVSIARADLLPNIQLSARALYQAGELNLLFNNWLLNLAANLMAPIFDGHRRKAEVERSRAVVDEKLAAYHKTVLTAIKEVEDALVSEATLREHINRLTAQLTATQNALEEARVRYRKGLNDYLPVLTSLLSVQNLERDLIQRRTDLLVTRVNLHRALGGTWTDELIKTNKPTK